MKAFKDQINKLKLKLSEHFSLKTSIKTLSNVIRNFYVISKRFDEINYGIENPKRFKVCLFLCISLWLTILWHLILTIPSVWSLVDGPFLPDHFKLCIFVVILAFLLAAFEKIDYLGAETNGYLDTFKVFYNLTQNLKSIHHLTDKNYKYLTIFSRIVITTLLDYGAPIISILINSLIILIAYLSYQNFGRFYWLFHMIVMSSQYVLMVITLTTTGCVFCVYFVYYKMRFNQLNQQIKSIASQLKWGMILNGKGKLLLQLIDEHNSLSLKIHNINLFYRKTAATVFVTLSLMKITTIYVTINAQHTLIRILIANAFGLCFVFGFILSTLFSLQISSAKSSYKIIHSIICKNKMRIQLKLKVSQIKVN